MPLVNAKCTNCGANLTVDESKDAAICEFCGAAYIVEKAINQYNTININNYTISPEDNDVHAIGTLMGVTFNPTPEKRISSGIFGDLEIFKTKIILSVKGKPKLSYFYRKLDAIKITKLRLNKRIDIYPTDESWHSFIVPGLGGNHLTLDLLVSAFDEYKHTNGS